VVEKKRVVSFEKQQALEAWERRLTGRDTSKVLPMICKLAEPSN
jgi:hypothetical protein